jgi:predicted nucleic acid-binding protein
MKVLFDTNVVLDVLLARAPHVDVAVQLFNLVDRGRLHGVLCATTITTIHYLATKAVGRAQAKRHLQELMAMFEIAPVDQAVLSQAIDLNLPDFEDAVLHESARAFGVAGIVTRNTKDFKGATLPVFSPKELLSGVVASES